MRGLPGLVISAIIGLSILRLLLGVVLLVKGIQRLTPSPGGEMPLSTEPLQAVTLRMDRGTITARLFGSVRVAL